MFGDFVFGPDRPRKEYLDLDMVFGTVYQIPHEPSIMSFQKDTVT